MATILARGPGFDGSNLTGRLMEALFEREPCNFGTPNMAKNTLAKRKLKPVRVDEAALIADLRDLIQSARQRVATVANAAQTLLYWRLGRRLVKENLQDRRAPYGKRIVVTVSRQLGAEFGDGFTLRSLYRSIQFFQLFPDETIVSTLSTQLSLSPFNQGMWGRWSSISVGSTSTNGLRARSLRSGSFCAPRRMPNRWNSSTWMTGPSGSANTSPSCRR